MDEATTSGDSRDSRNHWFGTASPEQKRAVLHVLLAVAAGDGRLAPEEKTAIAEACTHMGLSSFDVAEALVKGMPEAIEAPPQRGLRVRLLMDSVAVMVADRRIDDRELAVVLTVGEMLGFTTAEVTEAVSGVVRAIQAREQREEVLRRFLADDSETDAGAAGNDKG